MIYDLYTSSNVYSTWKEKLKRPYICINAHKMKAYKLICVRGAKGRMANNSHKTSFLGNVGILKQAFGGHNTTL